MAYDRPTSEGELDPEPRLGGSTFPDEVPGSCPDDDVVLWASIYGELREFAEELLSQWPPGTGDDGTRCLLERRLAQLRRREQYWLRRQRRTG